MQLMGFAEKRQQDKQKYRRSTVVVNFRLHRPHFRFLARKYGSCPARGTAVFTESAAASHQIGGARAEP